MQANAKIAWLNDKQFVGTDSSKHSVVISSQDEDNGIGMSPLDLLLVALGSCTAMGVVNILQKKRQDLRGFEIHLSGDVIEGSPRAIHSINLEYHIKGQGISEKTVEDAIKLSMEKYCSVSGTLKGQTEVVPSFKIIDI